jgi:hypothetical protein
MSTSIQEYSETESALAVLSEKYKGTLFDVTSPQGMSDAKKSRAELRGYRVALEKKRVEIKAPALKRTQEIDSEARRITAALIALEDPIDAQIKAEENKKENERLAKEKAEADRIEAEQRAAREAEEAKMAAERAEIARRQAEIAAAEKASRDKIEAEERAARQRVEEEERKARLEREEADRAARKAREAEEVKLKAERDKLEAERRAVEEKARKEREAEEVKEREILRRENERLDGVRMLEKFIERFGHRAEFADVVEAINDFLKVPA